MNMPTILPEDSFDQLRTDAARYRWLRQAPFATASKEVIGDYFDSAVEPTTPELIDALVDGARERFPIQS